MNIINGYLQVAYVNAYCKKSSIQSPIFHISSYTLIVLQLCPSQHLHFSSHSFFHNKNHPKPQYSNFEAIFISSSTNCTNTTSSSVILTKPMKRMISHTHIVHATQY